MYFIIQFDSIVISCNGFIICLNDFYGLVRFNDDGDDNNESSYCHFSFLKNSNNGNKNENSF